jgi:hypothetical protein
MKTVVYMNKEISDMRGEFCRGSWNPSEKNWNCEPCHWWVNTYGYNKDFLTLKAAKEYIKKRTAKCPICKDVKFLIFDGTICEDCMSSH